MIIQDGRHGRTFQIFPERKVNSEVTICLPKVWKGDFDDPNIHVDDKAKRCNRRDYTRTSKRG